MSGEAAVSAARAKLRERVREHRGKIRVELQTSFPDDRLIRYWEREIRAFEKGIERARKRLKGKG